MMEGSSCKETANGCAHFREYAAKNGFEEVHMTQSFLAASTRGIVHVPRRCMACGVDKHLHLCMHCVKIHCTDKMHIMEHAIQTKHIFSINFAHNQLFCAKCRDYIYDRNFEEIAMATAMGMRSLIKKRRESGIIDKKLLLTTSEVDRIRQNSDMYRGENFSHWTGIRGLINQGNTCFMNSSLQCLLHCPPLVRFFLNDQHSPITCELSKKGQTCVGCEFDTLVSAVYSGEPRPIAPHTLLYSVWKYVHHLAGYQQQDAQEFLIALLELLHSTFAGMESNCSCPIHSIFGGSLQSEIRCSKCGTASFSFEAFIDVSLWIYDAQGEVMGSLYESLENFSNVEKISKFFCSTCSTISESTKKLSFAKVPQVLFLHIKRTMGNNEKLSSFIEFPQVLDISPFLSKKWRISHSMLILKILNSAEKLEMDLIGIIIHKGNAGYGHYIANVIHDSCWYRFDDAKVSRTTIEEVLSSEA